MDKLQKLLELLDEKNDQNIIRQIASILYKYFEKRGRL